MKDETKELLDEIAIDTDYLNDCIGLSPEEVVIELRKIAKKVKDVIDYVEQSEGMNKSQSLTPIGADSDTHCEHK